MAALARKMTSRDDKPQGKRGGDITAPRSPSVLLPEELLRAGILSDPSTPAGAYKRARGLVRQGGFKEARTLLLPHQLTAAGGLRPKIAELLGVCAMQVGGEWQPLFEQALRDYRECGDGAGQARVLRHLGEMSMDAGKFKAADVYFRNAANLFNDIGEKYRAADVVRLRARVRVRAGKFVEAMQRVDESLRALVTLNRPREEALTRIDRAVILAYMGQAASCAKELVFAERLLATSGNQVDRVQARLRRAETLFILGDADRAISGIKRILADVVALDHVCTRAWCHLLLGRALTQRDPVAARRNLMRARHLYGSIDSAFGLANTDVFLGILEHRMGLNVLERLRGVADAPLGEWPLFTAYLQLARAEVIAKSKPENARRMLFEARTFATRTQNRYLMGLLDATLRRLELVNGEEASMLTPVRPKAAATIVQSAQSVVSTAYKPKGGPLRMDEALTDSLENSRLVSAVRLIDTRARTSPSLMLQPPGRASRRGQRRGA